MICIVAITKDESVFIRKKLNSPLRMDERPVYISRPTTNGKRFMEERGDAMRLLGEYRSGKYVNGGQM